MDTDTTLAGLLDEATGSDPGWGDMDDVRRRARRFARRRRLGGGSAVVLAIVAAGLIVGVRPSDGPATPVATGGEDASGHELLFARQLGRGGNLQVLTTGVEGEVQVVWPGSSQPTVLTPETMGDGDATSFMQGGTFAGAVRYGEMVLTEVDGQEWALISFLRCADDTAPVELRTWAEGMSPEQGDAMVFLDRLAIVAVPFTRPFGEGPGVPVYWELRDAAGNVLFADGPLTSDHEAEEPPASSGDSEPSGGTASGPSGPDEQPSPGEGQPSRPGEPEESGAPGAGGRRAGETNMTQIPGPVRCEGGQ